MSRKKTGRTAFLQKRREVIKEIKEHLDNNVIVTADGLKINDSQLREAIIDAILRAEGYRF